MENWKINHLNKINLETEDLITDDKIKIKVTKALLDNTDIRLLQGESALYPITPSHIAVGKISEDYSDLGLKFGEKVLLSPYISQGMPKDKKVSISQAVDTMGIDCDGFLADYVALDRRNVFILPETVKDKEALFVENIALGIKILSDLDVEKGETVVIIGGSSLSILICQLAIYYQAIPILIDTDASRLNTAGDMGVYYTINPAESDVMSQIMAFTSGRMADFVIYDPSTKAPLQPALLYCQKQGTIAIVGHNKAKVSVELSKVLEKQLKIIGINNGYDEIASAINLLATNSVNTDFIQCKEIEFEQAAETLEEYSKFPNAEVNIIVNIK